MFFCNFKTILEDVHRKNTKVDKSEMIQQQVFEGKRHGVHPQNGIPGFSFHFSKELSYGWYYEKWVGHHASFPPRRSVKRKKCHQNLITQKMTWK